MSRRDPSPASARAARPGPPAPGRRPHHVTDVEGLAGVLVESTLFARRERGGSDLTARYTLRGSGLSAVLRHRSADVGVLDEVFGLRFYEPPEPVARALARRARPLRVLDLGANIGLFGLWAVSRLGPVRLTAYEPDRFNFELLERCVRANGLGSSWRLVRACAGDQAGTVPFLEGRYACSRAAVPGDGPAPTRVPVVDVLPELHRVDLVKADMEGGEWAVLGDPRFARAKVAAVALEYHPQGCPEPHARTAAEHLLRACGYEIQPLFERPEGVGMLWAWLEDAAG